MNVQSFPKKIADSLCLTAALYSKSRYSAPKGTDLDRLRGDAARLGGDFKHILQREYGSYQAQQR